MKLLKLDVNGNLTVETSEVKDALATFSEPLSRASNVFELHYIYDDAAEEVVFNVWASVLFNDPMLVGTVYIVCMTEEDVNKIEEAFKTITAKVEKVKPIYDSWGKDEDAVIKIKNAVLCDIYD